MLKLENMTIELGSFHLKNLSLEVAQGEYFMLLGESGAGKSVILETIAGLVKPRNGKIFLNSMDITATQIQKRNIGLVFQDYALFPHLSVKENIAYPLKLKKISPSLIDETINQLAGELNILHLLKRRTYALSGGEKQRVALARTLTLKPEILLLDEPLTSIDVSLKGELRSLLRRLNQKGQTIIHVTHDYEEAITLAHRIAVIHQGTILQTGTPIEVFTHPKNRFVANFGGIKNFYSAQLETNPEKETIKAKLNSDISFQILTKYHSGKGFVLIGQKNILLSNLPHAQQIENQFKGVIKEIVPARLGYEVVVDCGILFYVSITLESIHAFDYKEGQDVWIAFNPSSVKFIPV